MRMHRVMLVAIALALAGASPSPGAGGPVLVGAVYPTGGSQGPGGSEEFNGVGLAAEYTNQRGGVHGRPIRLRLEAADSWDAAPGAVERLRQARVSAVVGSYGSTISRPAAETASRLGMIFWETGAVGDFGMQIAAGERVFRFAPTGETLGRAAVAFVRDQIAPRVRRATPLRYAVAYVDDVYGQAVARGAIGEVQESGLPLALVVAYRLPRVDYDALVRRIALAKTDVLMVVAYLRDGAELREAVVRAPLPLVANIGTSSSYCMPAFGQLVGKRAVGVFASDKPDSEVLHPDRLAPEGAQALRWARAEYRRRYGEAMSAAALTGFAGGLALFHTVLPSAHDLSTQAIARAAQEARLPLGALPNGSGLHFGPPGSPNAGANLSAVSVIWEWVAPYTRAVVWPPTFATHAIVVP
jgi:branched-chain amino acid transport system substrate-binding protein